MRMDEDEIFMEHLKEQLKRLHQQRLQEELNAAIELFFLKYFESDLLKLIEENGSEIKVFNKEQFIGVPCTYDMRRCMSDDLIVKIASLGYDYLAMYSDSNGLYFKKCDYEAE